MEITWSVISGGVEGENMEKGTGNKKQKSQVKIDREGLRIVWEMEKPKNLYV